MKFLTLNSHSWMEENVQQKFETLKEQILEAKYDVICFQEVNQEMGSEAVETDEYIKPCHHLQPFTKITLFAYWQKSQLLMDSTIIGLGPTTIIGYDHLNEGVAVSFASTLEGR